MDRASEYRPAKLRPLTSPTEIREATVRDYRKAMERAGIPVEAGALERQAVADCELVDAFERGVDRSPPAPAPPRQSRFEKRADPGDGLDLRTATSQADKSPKYADFAKLSARWPFAMGRLRRIMEGAQPHRDPLMVCATCEMPSLALEALRLQKNYLMRHRESRHNPFRGLGDIDARRALVRFVEDICDRSSARMGPWWVPK